MASDPQGELPSTHSPTDDQGTSGRPFAGFAGAPLLLLVLLLVVVAVVLLVAL